MPCKISGEVISSSLEEFVLPFEVQPVFRGHLKSHSGKHSCQSFHLLIGSFLTSPESAFQWPWLWNQRAGVDLRVLGTTLSQGWDCRSKESSVITGKTQGPAKSQGLGLRKLKVRRGQRDGNGPWR